MYIVHQGGAVTETPDMSVEVARPYLREMYDQVKAALSFNTQIVGAGQSRPYT